MVTAYMDVTVEVTNIYNKCELEYFMQKFAPPFTTLSGFLGFTSSLIEIIISADIVDIYKGISLAVYTDDLPNAGKWFGTWFIGLFDVKTQDAQLIEYSDPIGPFSNAGGMF